MTKRGLLGMTFLTALLLGWSATGAAAGSLDTTPVSDCSDRHGDSMSYKACLAAVSDALETRVRAALDAALEERATMDEAELVAGTGNADRVRRFDHAQVIWEEFLEAECEAAFAYVAPGSDASAAATRCRNTLLRERLRNLQAGY